MEVRRKTDIGRVLGHLPVGPTYYRGGAVVGFIERISLADFDPFDTEATVAECAPLVTMPVIEMRSPGRHFSTWHALDATGVSDEQLAKLCGWCPA